MLTCARPVLDDFIEKQNEKTLYYFMKSEENQSSVNIIYCCLFYQ